MYHSTRQIPQTIGINDFHFELLFHEYRPRLMMYAPIVVSIQIYTTIIAMSLQSLFNICVNSCPATASISLSFNFSINHDVNTIRESFWLHHVAKAFILLSWMIQIFGVGIHFVIHRFSTMLYILGLSFLANSFVPV